MAAKLLRKLISLQAALSSVAKLDLRCFVCAGGQAEFKKLTKERADDKRGRTAYDCSNGKVIMTTKKKKKKVPKGYLPVVVVGNAEEHQLAGGKCDVSGGYTCTCEVSGGCRCCYYVIRVRLLGHPLLGDILNQSSKQFGYSKYSGALRLPCDPNTFETLLTLIASM